MIFGKASIPRAPSMSAFEKALVEAANRVATGIKEDFEATVATWSEETKPAFTKSVEAEGKFIVVRVEATGNDEIYRYVNDGTKPHLIPKGGPGTLAFSEGYTAKTAPGVIGSRSGGSSGARIVRKTQIKHPGTEARNFDKIIAKKWQSLLAKEFGRAFAGIRTHGG